MMLSIRSLTSNASLSRVLLANLFIAFHTYLGLYVNSSYLKERLNGNAEVVSVTYILAAVVSLASFFLTSALLSCVGVYRLMLGLIFFQACALASLWWGGPLGITLVAFATYSSLTSLLIFGLDIFTETYMTDEQGTGTVRGLLLTTTNLALVLSPLAAGLLVEASGGYHIVYLVACTLLVPLFFLVVFAFRSFRDPFYRRLHIVKTLRTLWGNHDLLNIVSAHFIMRIFFSFMVIYLPLYLHEEVGFSWSAVGVMLSIALLPYLLMELPAGRLADKYFGEKELLAAGFLIAAIGTALFALPLGTSFLLWTLILLFSRIGASLIEIMTESYFFKHVQGTDADLVTFFRMLQPISYIVGPLLATIILSMFPVVGLWYVLATILLLGIGSTYMLKDTK